MRVCGTGGVYRVNFYAEAMECVKCKLVTPENNTKMQKIQLLIFSALFKKMNINAIMQKMPSGPFFFGPRKTDKKNENVFLTLPCGGAKILEA